MRERTMDEMIKYFNQTVAKMSIPQKDRMTLLGMITAIGFKYEQDTRSLREKIEAMKPKYDTVCVKCKYYHEANFNDKGFLICPACGMDITAWDFCSYFEKAEVESNDS